jgi:hypothetical protein
MSKSDIVDDLASVPDETIGDLVQHFTDDQFKLRPLLRAIFTHDDFVRIGYSADLTRGGSWSDPLAAQAHSDEAGPAVISSRLHGCGKLSYDTVGRLLSSFGVDPQRMSTPPSAAELYAGGAAAFGAANYPSRARETLQLSTGSALKLFDIFVQGAPEIIASMTSIDRCVVGGLGSAMFDRHGLCTLEGITCLKGSPAREEERILCNQIVSLASSPANGRSIAVAAILAATHTCE